MSSVTVPTQRVRPRPMHALGISAIGLIAVLSPYAWLDAWQSTGFSGAYVPFHLWGWAPFLLLAVLIGQPGGLSWRGGALASATVFAGTLASILLTQSLDTADRKLGIVLPGLLMLGLTGAWGVTAHRRRGRPRVASAALTAGVCTLVAAAVVAGRVLDVGNLDRLQTFLVIGTSIAVEALPFVLLGAAVSAAIEVFAPDRWFAAIARLPLPLQVPSVALAGLAMPVCECGSVPVARRLILRGVHPAAGVAFMLAAPVINPVVLLSTAVAYRGRGALEMVAGRAGLGLIVAIAAGTLIARAGGLRPTPDDHHDHHHHHGGRARGFVDHLAADLLLMGKFIVLGAALAAAMQTIVPQSVFTGLLTSPLVGALVMIVLAFLLSLCSEADAFVAVSFLQFPLGAQLAFLAAGPVLDTKLAMLYGASFGRAFVVKLALIVVPIVVGGSMVFQGVFG